MVKKSKEMVSKEKIVKQNALKPSGNVPGGVKVISILYYIGAAVLLLGAILAFVGSAFIGQYLRDNLGGIATAGAVVIGIIFIAFAILGFFIGRGLWKVQNWARIVAIVLAVIGILFGLLSLIAGDFTTIVGLVVNGLIGWYLWFNKDVKTAFA